MTDYRLAELKGLELLQQIKHQAPETPVILTTAYGTIENAVAAMKAGAYDYLAMPFSLILEIERGQGPARRTKAASPERLLALSNAR